MRVEVGVWIEFFVLLEIRSVSWLDYSSIRGVPDYVPTRLKILYV